MTTYQKGHEPAGAPVTWRPCPDGCGIIAYIDSEEFRHTRLSPSQCDAICRAFDEAATWRRLAEEARDCMDCLQRGALDSKEAATARSIIADIDAAKERLHE